MNIFKTNYIIIKMDNHEHQIELFRLGSIYNELSRPINVTNHRAPPPPPKKKCKMGLVCRECRKVAQHCCTPTERRFFVITFVFFAQFARNERVLERSSRSAYLILETTTLISIKFSKGCLH
jgi:hypothetical protein